MKNRTLNIAQFLVIVFLLVYITNVEYRNNENCENKKAEIVDQYFDLQQEYTKAFDAVIELEEENLRLQDYITELEYGR